MLAPKAIADVVATPQPQAAQEQNVKFVVALHCVQESGSRNSSVVRAKVLWSKGRGFESLQERWEDFLLQGQLSVVTLVSVSFPPLCFCRSM